MKTEHKWIVSYRVINDGAKAYYAYWSDENDRKYSTWYYEPFESVGKAEQWIKDINNSVIPFNTTSMTRTKY